MSTLDVSSMDKMNIISDDDDSTVAATDNNVSSCAHGKEGSDNDMNTCKKCRMVKYCSAACKKRHRHKHKKDCDEHIQRVTEHAAELHDKELFKRPPPKEDCPICFQQLPSLITGRRYKTCCGKVICCGCIHAPVYDNQGNEVDKHKCPFCRVGTPASDEEIVERLKKRVEVNDAIAINSLGTYYSNGMNGYPQNHTKALGLYQRAAELGYVGAYFSIGYAYNEGEGVEVDEKKANHYYELAAKRGNVHARHNLGIIEERAGNMDRAIKHYMIAVRGGENDSLNNIKDFYTNGHATKEDYTTALQLYQAYLEEIKSRQRDKAAAAHEQYRYY